MQGSGNGQVNLSETIENYSDFYLGPDLVDGVPVFQKVAVQSTSLYLNYGFNDQFDILLNIPYIRTRGSAHRPTVTDLEFENIRNGLQDMSIFLKMLGYQSTLGIGELRWVNVLGLELPASNYQVDEGFQSILAIGNQSQRISIRTMGLLQFHSGIFISLSGGYVAKNRRVPDAVVGESKIGLAHKDIYFEVFLENQNSISGADILALDFDGFFPSTRVNYTKTGASIYKPIGSGFGMSLAGSLLLNGRNIGNSTAFSLGIGYSFGPENQKLNHY